MKLRIRENTLRFRLSRSEVESFGETGSIEAWVRFDLTGQNDLCYKIEKAAGDEFAGTFSDGKITIFVPKKIADAWVGSSDVSIEGSQKFEGQTELSFLIEKDFVCLNAHDDLDQSDRFPHPKGPDAC